MNSMELPVNSKAGKGVLIDELAKLPEKSILDEGKLAAILRISPRTLRRMVSRAELPPPISLGGRSIWLSDRLLGYLNSAAERAERAVAEESRRISRYSP